MNKGPSALENKKLTANTFCIFEFASKNFVTAKISDNGISQPVGLPLDLE